MILANCKMASPGATLEKAFIELEGGLVKSVSAKAPERGGETLDASGLTAVPGFIDMHFHGAGGFDFCDGDPAGVERIAELKLREGVTTMIPTTLTLPEAELRKALASVASYMERPRHCKCPGVHLEGPFIAPEWKGAQNPDFIRKPDVEEVLRLDAIAKVLLVSFAIEVEGGLELVESLRRRGIAPSCGHSGASFAQFKEAKARGLRSLTHFCNQMSPLRHRELGLLGAGLLDDAVRVELICDRLHVCEDMLKLIFKSKGSAGVALVTDSLRTSWMGEGEYSLGGLKVVVKGGEARLASNGALAGSNLKFNEALRNASEASGLPLSELLRCSSLNQAETLGLKGLGRIEPGFAADIVLLDDAFEVKGVFVDGTRKL